jgi:hypothetical protein
MKLLVASLAILVVCIAASADAHIVPSGIRVDSYFDGGPPLRDGERERPAVNPTIVVTRRGQPVAIVHKEPRGVFLLRLKPATYELTPELQGQRCGRSHTVTVRPHSWPIAALHCAIE